jgi:L-ribulokinase
LFGAVAAEAFPDIHSAIQAMRPPTARTYLPDPEAQAIYDRVYPIYRELYELLGRSEAELLHGLKRIRDESSGLLPKAPA